MTLETSCVLVVAVAYADAKLPHAELASPYM